MSNIIFHPANTRGHADHGWLNAHHSFSFAGYHDPERIHFGALRVLNDDIVMGGMGFGKHPHDNMEIITIVLDGALEHKDSMGHTEAIRENEVQVMSAGTGVFHSEYNHNPDKAVNLLQIWMFPNKKNVKPQYDQRLFDPSDRDNKLQTLVSPMEKGDAGLQIHQDAWIYRSNLKAGNTIQLQPHSENHGFYVFVIDGAATAGGQVLGKRDAVGLSDTGNIEISAGSDSDILILEVPMQF